MALYRAPSYEGLSSARYFSFGNHRIQILTVCGQTVRMIRSRLASAVRCVAERQTLLS